MTNVSKFEDAEADGYVVNVIGRNTIVSEAMKNHVHEKLAKIDRFHDHVLHVTVTLDIQKTDHICSIVLKIDHLEVVVHASTSDMYASIDEAVRRLQSKLRRWKDRIHHHHNKKGSVVDMHVNVFEKPVDEIAEFNAEIEAENRARENKVFSVPKIIGTHTLPLKTLTAEEALMKMELSERTFLIFKDEKDQKLKVLYRLPDGNYGIVQPN